MVLRKRPALLNVRMLDAEIAMLRALAVEEGVSMSEWIRNVVRARHALLATTRPTTKKRPLRRPPT
jgi:hypothetical protein